MTNWQHLARITADQARRNWASRYTIIRMIADEISDADALLAELDDQWRAIELIDERIRHQCRRIEHLETSQTLEIHDREKY